MTVPSQLTSGPANTLGDVAVLTRLLLRLHTGRARLAGLALLSSVAVASVAATRAADDPVEAGTALTVELGLGVVLPVAIAWLGTSVLGDLVEDRTLVYLWHRPVRRGAIAVAAVAASVLVTVPVVGVPLVAAAAVADAPGLVAPVAASVALGTAAYSALFVAAGARLRRGLWFALGYVLAWENGVARIGDGPARVSVSSYLQSLPADAMDVSTTLSGRGTVPSVVVPLAVAVVATAASAVFVSRREID